MDAVDQKQQDEIVDLQKKDIAHDAELKWLKLTLRACVGALIVWTIITAAFFMTALQMIEKSFKIISHTQADQVK